MSEPLIDKGGRCKVHDQGRDYCREGRLYSNCRHIAMCLTRRVAERICKLLNADEPTGGRDG